MKRSYEVVVYAESRPETFDVEASSKNEALFLVGVQWGQDNPEAIPAMYDFKVVIDG